MPSHEWTTTRGAVQATRRMERRGPGAAPVEPAQRDDAAAVVHDITAAPLPWRATAAAVAVALIHAAARA